MNEICLFLVSVCVGYAMGLSAECNIEESSGDPEYALTGKITFSQTPGQNVSIDISLSGFNTTDEFSMHGFHVHTEGSLGDGCKDALGHFNPAGVDHGSPQDAVRHVGDLGNIKEGDDGSIMHTFTDHFIQLEGNYSIIGRSIVVHAREDDLGLGGESDSKTTGHAGARLGCCLILDTSGGEPDQVNSGTTPESGMESGTESGMESGMTSSGGVMTTMSGDSDSGSGSGSSTTTLLGREGDKIEDDDNGGLVMCSINLALLVVCGVLGWASS